MTLNVDTLISSAEAALNHLSNFKRAQEPGGDLHLVADDATEALYALLDAVALRRPAPDLTEG